MKNFAKTVALPLIWSAEIAVAWLFIENVSLILPKNYGDANTSILSNQFDAEIEAEISQSPVFKLNNSDSVSLPLLLTGISEKKVLRILGEPTWRKPGYWDNSIAWSYKNMFSPNIDIGLIFDVQTQKLRQAEIALPPGTKLENLYSVLDSFLYFTPAEIEQKLEAVYWRQTDHQEFEIDNLKAIIQRNEQDRIYIGVWEADFH